jgi:peptidyl-prolyl cis-trans isomerase B (cyclophilin B)
MKFLKFLILVIVIIGITIVFSGCKNNNPIVTIRMKSGDIIKMELYPEIAPNTVKNFVYLVDKGFYNGLTFHRVIPGFIIQGGSPDGSDTGGPGYYIKGEFAINGLENKLLHKRGTVSMARRLNDNNTAGSQFFIMVGDKDDLDGAYAAFGKVFAGMDVVDKIVKVPADGNGKPAEDQIMESVTVDNVEKIEKPVKFK